MGQTVLVVDDEPDFLDLVDAVLSSEGYRVVTCSDSSQAHAKARFVHPDVAIVDLMMPNQSGWQVIEDLKTDPATVGCHIILCTAAAAEAKRRAEALKPRHDILLKPFDLADLLSMVGKFAESKAS